MLRYRGIELDMLGVLPEVVRRDLLRLLAQDCDAAARRQAGILARRRRARRAVAGAYGTDTPDPLEHGRDPHAARHRAELVEALAGWTNPAAHWCGRGCPTRDNSTRRTD